MGQKLLSEILQKAQDSQKNGESLPVFFDLDSTLFDVSPRISKILHDFALLPEIQSQYPEASASLLKLTPSPRDWGIKRTLERHQFVPPGDKFIKKLVAYWHDHFFSSRHLHHDRPYEGVKEFLANLHQAGASISYLTGRDIPRMFEGSKTVLKSHGFPLGPNFENLFLKPSTGMKDHEFKVEFFKERCEQEKQNIIYFENEPAIIHPLLEHCPRVEIIFVDTVHSHSAPPVPEHIPRLQWPKP